MTPLEWKTIDYRGLIEFRIPAGWIEEYDENGATFYEPTPHPAPLRLSVLTLGCPTTVTADTPFDLLGPRAKEYGAELTRLPDNNALISFSTPAEEGDISIVVRRWELAHALPPLKIPRFRGHPNWRENAPGVIHGQTEAATEAASVHA